MFLRLVPTRLLARELARRDDLTDTCVNSVGLLDREVWPLRPKLGAVSCVDAVAVMRKGDDILGCAIRRKTGRFPGKLALVGGVVGLNESIEAALKRHFATDLGLSISLIDTWDRPVSMRQYAPQKDGENLPDFHHDPGKHSVASTHLVVIQDDLSKLTFGSTSYGGQEAMGLEWFTLTSCPTDEEWSYNMRELWLTVVRAAETRAW